MAVLLNFWRLLVLSYFYLISWNPFSNSHVLHTYAWTGVVWRNIMGLTNVPIKVCSIEYSVCLKRWMTSSKRLLCTIHDMCCLFCWCLSFYLAFQYSFIVGNVQTMFSPYFLLQWELQVRWAGFCFPMMW